VQNHGTPSERMWARIVKGDGCWLWTGSVNEKGYGRVRTGRGQKPNSLATHRIAYMDAYGSIPDGVQIDHTCFNHACVNPEHLRLATAKQNNENRAGANKNNRSGVRGVSWDKQKGRWIGTAVHNRHRHYAGSFATVAAAESAVIALRCKLFTHNDSDRIAA
jgi:HNH endonuclease/AP2 domain